MASAKKQQYTPVKYYWMVAISCHSTIIHPSNRKGNKMLLANSVTTIAFRDADLDILVDALRAYRTTAADLDAVSGTNRTTTALASVMDLVRVSMMD
jgi:hypothetical protein